MGAPPSQYPLGQSQSAGAYAAQGWGAAAYQQWPGQQSDPCKSSLSFPIRLSCRKCLDVCQSRNLGQRSGQSGSFARPEPVQVSQLGFFSPQPSLVDPQVERSCQVGSFAFA